jgi:TetR/AcrR family tetracycline transcriptional repressor
MRRTPNGVQTLPHQSSVFTFGHVIEEQTPLATDMIADFDMEQFKKDHPTFVAGIEEYFSAGHTADDLFNDGLRLIVNSR